MSEVILKAVQEHADAVTQFKQATENKLNVLSAQITDIELKNARKGSKRSAATMANTLIESFTKSAQLQSMREGANTTGRVTLQNGSVEMLRKADIVNSGTGEFAVPAQRANGLYGDARRPLSLLDVLPSLEVTSGTFEFMQLSNYQNSAAVQTTEGSVKAEANIQSVPVQAQISTIAHWVRASTQVLQDAPALERQLGDLLAYGVQAKLENEIINGTGGQGRILGLVPQATPYIPTPALSAADRIGEAATALSAAGWQPGLVVMNPVDWFAIASERSEGDGQYVLGSPRDPSPPSVWGYRIITNPSLARGTALVLDPAQVAVLDRMEPTVMASREAGDAFVTNTCILLAELRAGLAVFATGAVVSVALA